MTRAKSLVLAAASILALGVANGAGAQTRDARSVTRPAGVISGTVVSDDTERRPVRRARVTCAGGDFAASAITDDAGAFAFRGLKAGRYTIAATKDAWPRTLEFLRRNLK